MKAKELIALLQNVDPETEVLIADNGSILDTGSAQDTLDYNADCAENGEFFVVTKEWE